jgi:MHS family proline/betaine transporter-like MFS transporter
MNKTTGLKTKSDFAKIIAAATVGNALEFYDLFIYGLLAIVIAKVFFPAGSEFISLLITVATFGASYIMRPLGAVILGGYSDSRGRKAGMMLTIWTMGVGTALIAFAPGYVAVGLLGPLIVVTGKLMQGFSAGGEFGTSVSFVTEHAPYDRKGFLPVFRSLASDLRPHWPAFYSTEIYRNRILSNGAGGFRLSSAC